MYWNNVEMGERNLFSYKDERTDRTYVLSTNYDGIWFRAYGSTNKYPRKLCREVHLSSRAAEYIEGMRNLLSKAMSEEGFCKVESNARVPDFETGKASSVEIEGILVRIDRELRLTQSAKELKREFKLLCEQRKKFRDHLAIGCKCKKFTKRIPLRAVQFVVGNERKLYQRRYKNQKGKKNASNKIKNEFTIEKHAEHCDNCGRNMYETESYSRSEYDDGRDTTDTNPSEASTNGSNPIILSRGKESTDGESSDEGSSDEESSSEESSDEESSDVETSDEESSADELNFEDSSEEESGYGESDTMESSHEDSSDETELSSNASITHESNNSGIDKSTDEESEPPSSEGESNLEEKATDKESSSEESGSDPSSSDESSSDDSSSDESDSDESSSEEESSDEESGSGESSSDETDSDESDPDQYGSGDETNDDATSDGETSDEETDSEVSSEATVSSDPSINEPESDNDKTEQRNNRQGRNNKEELEHDFGLQLCDQITTNEYNKTEKKRSSFKWNIFARIMFFFKKLRFR